MPDPVFPTVLYVTESQDKGATFDAYNPNIAKFEDGDVVGIYERKAVKVAPHRNYQNSVRRLRVCAGVNKDPKAVHNRGSNF